MRWIGQITYDEVAYFREDVIIEAGNKLGIGTTSPASALHVAGTVQVGVDDTGHDVIFYGATSGKKMQWDESADTLIVDGSLDINGSSNISGEAFFTNSIDVTSSGHSTRFRDGHKVHFNTARTASIYTSSDDLYIENGVDDKDIIFRCDDGSGGETAYLTLDGSTNAVTFHKLLEIKDNVKASFGNGGDLQIYHDASNSYIAQGGTGDLYIQQNTADKDIVFQSDDGSGGTATYLTLDGSAGYTTAQKQIRFADSVEAQFGGVADLTIAHDATNSIIANNTGDLQIKNRADDKDIIFETDDGSGGTTAYLTLDGSAGTIEVAKTTRLADSVSLKLGSATDLELFHDGTNSFINNNTGPMFIRQNVDDGDIRLQSDNGSGGVTDYLTLDGGLGYMTAAKSMRFSDSVSAFFGNSNDLTIQHDGSNSYINNGTGDLYIRQNVDDKDIIFQSDDGSGGVTAYLTLDGSAGTIEIAKAANFANNVTIQGSGDSADGLHLKDRTFVAFSDAGSVVSRFRSSAAGVFQLQDGSYNTGITLKTNATSTFTGGGITVGVDDTGHDVRFYGATSGRYMEWDESSDRLEFTDNASLSLGAGADLHLFHDGTDSWVNNANGNLLFVQNANDKDIVFYCDDGSGGVEEYFRLDGSAGGANPVTIFPDNSYIHLGSGQDMVLGHTGSDTYITNNTGDLYIQNKADDKDVIFQSDDQSGGVHTYFFLDGSSGHTTFPDSKILSFGDSQDLRINHDGSTASIFNTTGNLQIINYADDSDVKLMSDDGSGGVTPYLTLDGGLGHTTVQKTMRFDDNARADFGAGYDLQIKHDGTNSYIDNGSGDLYIRQKTADKDLILQCDDGSGGETAYLTLDGSAGNMKAATNMRFSDSKQLQLGDGGDLSLQHDGSASYISNSVGNVFITQNANDGDIFFKSDDGSGGTAIYLALDGGEGRISTKVNNRFDDSARLELGTSGDLDLYHDGSHSYINNVTGNIVIRNQTNDGDISFQADNGSGGDTTYLTFDGSAGTIEVAKPMNLAGNLVVSGAIISAAGTNANLEMNAGSDIVLEADNAGGGNASSIQYLDAGGTNRIMLGASSDVVQVCNRAANGTVVIKANTSTAGGGGETLAATFTDTETTLAGNLVVSGAQIDFSNVPTSDPEVAGRVWNSSGDLKISAGA